ncbi:type II secretion system protein [Candidatus Dojkabacteria bacterium]|nr:type II secretion system protein [Candidatus Dojkabacteria bacterium]
MKMIKKYNAVSLVEMLITMVILGIVMILVSITLSTMIRTSIISTSRTTTREESEFILELLRKTVRNSNAEEIFLYQVSGRMYDKASERTVDSGLAGYDTPITSDQTGTEIHFRPVGYNKWVCIGFFPDSEDPERGYILKSIRQDLEVASECFNGQSSFYTINTLVLNSEDVDVNSLSMQFFNTYDSNYLITIDLEMEPVHWVANSGSIKPGYFKQTVVSTQKLTWEN